MVGVALTLLVALGSLLQQGVRSTPIVQADATPVVRSETALPAPFCFPALGFVMPPFLPPDNTHWWCDPSTEYAFVGFSYEVTACECETYYRSEHPVYHGVYRSNPGAAAPRVRRHPLSLQLSVRPIVWSMRQGGLLVRIVWVSIHIRWTRLSHVVMILSMPHGITD